VRVLAIDLKMKCNNTSSIETLEVDFQSILAFGEDLPMFVFGVIILELNLRVDLYLVFEADVSTLNLLFSALLF
jgi:hypothetical protein